MENEFVPQKLNEQVFERIKDKIRTGEFRKGDLLPSEKELMDDMGVSRVTVRQALKKLAESGVIETYRGRGSVVLIDWKEILDGGTAHRTVEDEWNQFEQSARAKRLIEPVIAREAAGCATEEDIRRMEQAIEAGRNKAVTTSSGYTQSHAQDFHQCLWESVHNPFLMTIYKPLKVDISWVQELALIPPTFHKAHFAEVEAQHRQILEAVREHNGDYAYFYMCQHQDWILKVYGEYFKDFMK